MAALAPNAPAPAASADVPEGDCDIVVESCTFSTTGLITGNVFDLLLSLNSYELLMDFGETNDVSWIVRMDRFAHDLPALDPNALAAALLARGTSPEGRHFAVGFMDGALTLGQAITLVGEGPADLDNFYYYFLARNPGRANGGLAARFDWLYSLSGASAVSGNAVFANPCDVCRYEPEKMDVGLGYDSISDFPVTPLASFSIINSIMQSFFITNVMGGYDDVLQEALNPDSTVVRNTYRTLVPYDSALLEPLRLAKRIQALLGVGIPIPLVGDVFVGLPAQLADALEPAADILINVGYADVDLSTYQRSFTDFDENKQFLFDSTLTLGDYFTAVVNATSAALAGLTGLLTGNPKAAAATSLAPTDGPRSAAADHQAPPAYAPTGIAPQGEWTPDFPTAAPENEHANTAMPTVRSGDAALDTTPRVHGYADVAGKTADEPEGSDAVLEAALGSGGSCVHGGPEQAVMASANTPDGARDALAGPHEGSPVNAQTSGDAANTASASDSPAGMSSVSSAEAVSPTTMRGIE